MQPAESSSTWQLPEQQQPAQLQGPSALQQALAPGAMATALQVALSRSGSAGSPVGWSQFGSVPDTPQSAASGGLAIGSSIGFGGPGAAVGVAHGGAAFGPLGFASGLAGAMATGGSFGSLPRGGSTGASGSGGGGKTGGESGSGRTSPALMNAAPNQTQFVTVTSSWKPVGKPSPVPWEQAQTGLLSSSFDVLDGGGPNFSTNISRTHTGVISPVPGRPVSVLGTCVDKMPAAGGAPSQNNRSSHGSAGGGSGVRPPSPLSRTSSAPVEGAVEVSKLAASSQS